MLNLPPPPEPPKNSEEFLNSLEEYYRQLCSYHESGLSIANQKLSQIQALLEPIENISQKQIAYHRDEISDETKNNNYPDKSNVSPPLLEFLEKATTEEQKNNHDALAIASNRKNLSGVFIESERHLMTIPNGITSVAIEDELLPKTDDLFGSDVRHQRVELSSSTIATTLKTVEPDIESQTERDFAPLVTTSTSGSSETMVESPSSEPVETIPVTEKTTTAIEELIDKTKASAKLLITNATVALEVEGEDLKTSVELEKQTSKSSLSVRSPEAIEESIANLLSENRGTIVHINYIIREIYGQLPTEKSARVKKELIKVLSRGEEEGRWSKVPDSPGGWTIDLKELPVAVEDGEEENLDTEKEQKEEISFIEIVEPGTLFNEYALEEGKENKARIDNYKGLTAALEDCLRSHPHQPLNLDQIYEWIYGYSTSVDLQQKRSQRDLMAQTLSYAVRRGVARRLDKGVYIWKGVEGKIRGDSLQAEKRESSQFHSVPDVPITSPSSKKKRYQNLTEAVKGCLRSHPQQPMNIDSIYEWILENAKVRMFNSRTARKNVAGILVKGCDRKGWTRVGVGVYQWIAQTGERSSTSDKSMALTVSSSTLSENMQEEDVKSSEFKHFPYGEKLSKYENLQEMVSACLKELAPNPVKTSDVIDWLYPKGLDNATRQLVYHPINKTLNKHEKTHWSKLKQGIYIFDESLV